MSDEVDMTTNVQSIRYGMFIMPFHPPDKPLAQCIDEDIELVVRAEALGFDEFWIGEHHTLEWENITAPDLFIAKALALTKNIKLGTGVVLLQLHRRKLRTRMTTCSPS